MTLDYRAYNVLYVDDEPQNLAVFRATFEDQFTIITTTSPDEALRILKEGSIAVLMADQRMPGMTGAELCAAAREVAPFTARIIVTAYAELQAAMAAINEGQVLRYLKKPWHNDEVVDVLRMSIDLVHLQRTVREMEVRLLRSGQSSSAYAVEQELAHELASPLSGLVLSTRLVADMLQTALRALGDRPQLESLLTHASEAQTDAVAAVEQMRALVTRLREGQRPSVAPPVRACDAARVIDSTWRIVRHELEKKARVDVLIEAQPSVTMESSALGQVVLNLLLNAAQAITGPRRDHQITLRLTETKTEAKLTISDTGPGISPEHQARMFEPYFSTKASQGIGLAIVRELVRQAGGRVSVQSEVGHGATFTVALPRLPGV